MLKIATWNVNSIKARLPHLLRWLQEAGPDVVLLQELKCMDDAFPRLEIEALGYHCESHGQKTYNGVAILSRLPMEIVRRGLPDLDGGLCESDPQARYIEARIDGKALIASLYLPNGNPVDSEKYPYKLGWMDRLVRHAQRLQSSEEIAVLAGDYNICPTDEDVYDPIGWKDDAACRLESRERFWSLIHSGWTDAYRALNREPNRYSFWDYQAGAWAKDHGVRIDHLLLSPSAADKLISSGIDKKVRGEEKASDHVPVWCTLDL